MAMLFTLLLGVSAAILGCFLYDFSKQEFVRETEAVIDFEITAMLDALEDTDQQTVSHYILNKSRSASLSFFRYEDIAGNFLAGDIRQMPAAVDRVAEGIVRFSYDDGKQERMLAAKIHTFSDGSRVMVARDIHDILDSYNNLQHFSFLIMFLMALVVGVSFLISHFVVSRINIIAGTAQQIMDTGDLSRRISIGTQWDDLSNLAQILNRFLERTESQMQATREVSNNIAHDLRTPLTRLRNQIEELKERQPTAQDMDSLLAEADHLLAIFHSLLRIANIEQGKRHQAFEDIDGKQLITDVVELYEPVAEQKHIELLVLEKQRCILKGDKHLLFQLFANLVDNAIKYSPERAIISITVHAHQIRIDDNGPGIPDAEKDNVFRRFYRADSSRNSSGNGLGLSLAKAITELHHADIALENNSSGLSVVVTFQPYQ